MVTRANFGSCERRVVRKWRVDDKYGMGRCFWRYVGESVSTCIDDDNVELLRFSVEIWGNEYNLCLWVGWIIWDLDLL